MIPSVGGRGLGVAFVALLALLPVVPSFCEAACAAEAMAPGEAAGHCGEDAPGGGGKAPQDPVGSCPGHDHPEVALAAAGRPAASPVAHGLPAAVAEPLASFPLRASRAALVRSARFDSEHSPPARPILRL